LTPFPELAVLPAVPIVDARTGGSMAILEAHRYRADELLAGTRRALTPLGLRIADHFSRRWFARTNNLYQLEVAAVAARLAQPGAWALNLSYEWACTTGGGPDPERDGLRLMRTLDWRQRGLGTHVLVARRAGQVGDGLDVTWAGAVGSFTAMAPGRFAVAINQPPMRRRALMPMPLDWLMNRRSFFATVGLPPAHLLRCVVETAADFEAACTMLATGRLVMPAFFTLVGTKPGEVAVIERTEMHGTVHRDASLCIANHWLTENYATARGRRPRNPTSHARQARLTALSAAAPGLEWIVPPILDPTTRLGVVANPAAGTMVVQGFEGGGAVTAPTEFAA
jgi:hypothetical protein